MRVIHKYELTIVDEQEVMMPITADLLTVDWQGSTPCLWASIDPAGERAPRRIVLVGTGHQVPPGLKYLNTIQMQGGTFVLHWFGAAK